MSQEITVTMLASQAQLLNELSKQQMAIQKSIDKFQKLGQESKRTTDSAETGITRVVGKLSGMAAGYLSVSSAVGTITSEMQKLTREADAAMLKLEDVQKQWRVTSGLRGLESEASQRSIERIANQNAVPTEQAYAAANQLVSNGVPAYQASGAALGVFLKTQAAMSVGGKEVNQKELAIAAAGYLNSQGMDLDDKSMLRLGKGMSGVRAGAFELDDLKSLAKEGAVLKAIPMEEQLAAATVLKNSGMENPGVALRNLLLNMQTGGSEEGKLKILERMKLKPTDFDLIGEDLDTGIANIQAGLQRLPEEERATATKKLFEREGIATLNLLSTKENRALMKEYVDLAKKGEEFDTAAAEMQAGPGAARVRLENQREQRMADMALDVEGRSLAMGEAAIARGALPIQAELQRRAFEGGTYATGSLTGGRVAAGALETLPSALLSLGLSAIGGPLGGLATGQVLGAQARSTGQGLGEAERQYMETMQAHTEALKENTAATKANTNATSGNGSTPDASSPPRPAAPRPSQARSR